MARVHLGSALFALGSLVAAGFIPRPAETVPLLITGDAQGYLSPCGCSDPMTGGIRRQATALAQLRGKNGVFIVNGGLISQTPLNGTVGFRQNQFKAETFAEAYDAMGADAINLGPEELSGGPSMLAEIKLLAPGRVLSTSVSSESPDALPRWKAAGPFLIGGVTAEAGSLAGSTGGTPVEELQAAHDLVAEAKREGKTPVLMLRDSHDVAKRLAEGEPGLRLIIFKAGGTASTAPESVGQTLLLTPGDRAQQLVRINFDGDSFSNYDAPILTPEYSDDVKVNTLFQGYLKRIDRANLLAELPRHKTGAFAGSEACMNCHAEAYAVWHASGHAHTLKDLEHVGQAHDPDCVSCHVTGLNSTVGFTTRLATPRLAAVTCESCHGPAAAHVASPKTIHLPKIGKEICLSCHTPDNSHNFSFDPYWKRVSHH